MSTLSDAVKVLIICLCLPLVHPSFAATSPITEAPFEAVQYVRRGWRPELLYLAAGLLV